MNRADYRDAVQHTGVTTDHNDILTLALMRRDRQRMTSNDMMPPPVQENVSILHELDLGLHTLFLLSDGSIDLLANDEQTLYLAENGLHLDTDETYRLFISLYEQFKHKDICQEE